MPLRTRSLLSFARSIVAVVIPKIATRASFSSALLELDGSYYAGVFSCNRTIDKLIKCGRLHSAVEIFEAMSVRDVVSWNLVIAGHARYGFPELALDLFKEMVSRGLRESSSTCSSVLGICSGAGFYREGLQVHCRVVLLGFNVNLFVGSALIDLYLQASYLNPAMRLFDELPGRSLATWNLVLRGFSQLSRSYEVLGFYLKMKSDVGVRPNGVTFCYLIYACGVGRLLDEGKQLHCQVIKGGWLQSNLFVANALVDFYSACGSLTDTRKSFEIIPVEDVLSWNSVVSVYADNGLLHEALEFFARMQCWGKNPSIRSFVAFLNAAIESKTLQFGEQVHCCVLKLGFDCVSIHLQSALVNMYGKCGQIESSVALFEDSPERTLECCNSLMTSLLHCGAIEDVVEMFGLMMDEGVGLDHVSFSTTLKALSSSALASLTSCALLHCCIIKSGFELDMVVSCSLIDAYSKCGHIQHACQVFKQIPAPNLICFTSLITGYARHGMGREGLKMLETMIQEGLKPDAVTFLSVLMGCSHSGLVREGQLIFESMETIHAVYPDRRHYSCMVDLLGRAGLLEEAEVLLKCSPVKGDSVMWSSLLRSCIVHRNEKVGRRAAIALLELDPDNPAVLLQASNFYSEIGDTEMSMKIREYKETSEMRKGTGYSFIESINHGYS
ncbi:PREDICTED: pentatricopeptide repeat-containing protein At1g74600, chloroplastic [Nelumbo nucifera]|nr:PREDICTED: pentatricopeptide repeat-containing protein At1g74600, chloroplastic [Nelumbo nucifera]